MGHFNKRKHVEIAKCQRGGSVYHLPLATVPEKQTSSVINPAGEWRKRNIIYTTATAAKPLCSISELEIKLIRVSLIFTTHWLP